MTTKTIRKIIRIDEEKCDGCGACLGECPQGAITIEERVAEEFDEDATNLHLEKEKIAEEKLPCGCSSAMVTEFKKPHADTLPCGCSSATVTQFEKPAAAEVAPVEATNQPSMLGHWPIQLTLVPPTAPFLQGADVVLAADCVPFAYAGFHQDFIKDHVVLVACPKLDDFHAHLNKLTDILSQSSVKSLTVVHMEVPCCNGLTFMVKQAMLLAGKDIPLKDVTVGIRGDLKPQ